MDDLRDRTSEQPKKLDSLFALYQKLYSEVIVGFMKIYSPSSDHISLDSLLRGKDLSAIKKVSIYNYTSDDLPDVVLQCKNLESLELIKTRIRQLPDGLNELTKLSVIRIYNHRSKHPLKLKKNNYVTSLIIRGGNPKNLPRSYRSFSALKTLDLAGNFLTRFPQGARRNEDLRELSLQENRLTLRQRLKKHPYVETLALQHNRITRVPASIRAFISLRKLGFNYNQISSVHRDIRMLTKLENLSFYHNELPLIPSGVYEMEGLREIDLFYNKIETVENRLSQWKNLRMLYLSHNKILSLPEDIGNLPSLEGLYIWDNRITRLPEGLGNIKTLRFLWANNNNLLALPRSLFDLEKMEELDLSHNFLTEIPESVFDLRRLKILSLVDNPWNDSTMQFIPRRAEELRAKNVFVHIPDK